MKTKPAKRLPMILTTEGGLRREHPSEGIIFRILNDVDTGLGNSFCGLELPGNNYIQALHGLNGWHLEWRVTNPRNIRRYRHYRAANVIGSNRKRLLRKSDKFVSRGLERDLLDTEDVVQCFLAFLRLEARPKHFMWRRLNI